MSYFNIYNNSIKQIENHCKNVVKETAQNNDEQLIRLISSIANKIKDCETLVEANKFFDSCIQSIPAFEKIDNNVYKYKDYFFNIGKHFQLSSHAYNLKEIRNLNLSSAPEVIAYADLKNELDSVLITRIKGAENKMPVQYSSEKLNVSEDAKRKLIEDIDKLAKTNNVNLGILDMNNWFFIPSINRILISDWSHIVQSKDQSSMDIFKNKVCNLCNLIYR